MIDDNGLDISLLIDANDKKFISFNENCYMYPNHKKAEHFNSSFEYLEFQIDKAPIPIEIKSIILHLVEKKTVTFDIDEMIGKIKREMDNDLLNNGMIKSLNLNPENLEDTKIDNIGGLFTLARDNQSMLYTAILNTESLICGTNYYQNNRLDFQSKNIAETNKSINSYNYIANKFGVPDFTELIINDTISFEQFIELRTKKGASKFREWLSELEFDKEGAIEDLLNNIPGKKNKNIIINTLRWAFTNAIGIVEPISGIVASTFDSFIIEKLISGWSPNVYLNESLKSHLDKKISKKVKRDKSKNRFNA